MNTKMNQQNFDRFIQYEPNSGCWLWFRYIDPQGYGRKKVEGKMISAHRFMWAAINGPIPAELCVLHRCDVRACVNPAHLFLGTQAENMADMVRKGRQVSLRGEAAGNSRLNKQQVAEIRALYASGYSQQKIAKRFSIAPSHASNIVTRKVWL